MGVTESEIIEICKIFTRTLWVKYKGYLIAHIRANEHVEVVESCAGCFFEINGYCQALKYRNRKQRCAFKKNASDVKNKCIEIGNKANVTIN